MFATSSYILVSVSGPELGREDGPVIEDGPEPGLVRVPLVLALVLVYVVHVHVHALVLVLVLALVLALAPVLVRPAVVG